MPDTGWIIAGAGANNSDDGTVPWSNPDTVTADDGAYASAQLINNTSQYLHATSFSLEVPSGATINGVMVRIQRAASSNNRGKDHTVQLIVNGVRSGNNYADTATTWTTTFTDVDYGGATNLWGLSLTRDQVVASNFGVAVRTITEGGNVHTRVDVIWMRVFYTEASGARSLPFPRGDRAAINPLLRR